jgi:hypothetical protein
MVGEEGRKADVTHVLPVWWVPGELGRGRDERASKAAADELRSQSDDDLRVLLGRYDFELEEARGLAGDRRCPGVDALSQQFVRPLPAAPGRASAAAGRLPDAHVRLTELGRARRVDGLELDRLGGGFASRSWSDYVISKMTQ